MSRDILSELLKSWSPAPTADPQFQAAVWSRIQAAARTDRARAFYRWALPLAASIAMAIGVGSAIRQEHREHDNRMAADLVRAVDPLQMMDPHTHSP